MNTEVRVRYAPSPTGHLHIGNSRTALFNYLFARHAGGKFIIRIEDTDVKRNVAGGEESQLQYLKWLGMDWDESIDVGGEYGPYRQTERLHLYQKYAQQLIANGQAYYCYCTEEELEQEREQQLARGETPMYSGKHRHLSPEERQVFEDRGLVPSIRFRVPEGRVYAFDDMVKGSISFDSEGIGDFVIVKKDGIATYNFAVVVDDYSMQISHVLRGEDHISNTPRQLMIYEALGWQAPVFGHMTLIVNENRKKLSKRDESIIQFIEQYDQLGYLPEALVNFIALLGWSPEGEEEILSLEQLIQAFDSKRLSTSPAVFDVAKLNYLNNHYLKQAEPARVAALCIPHLIRAGLLPEALSAEQQEWAGKLVALYQEQLTYGAEIVSLSAMFFQEDAVLENDEAAAVLQADSTPIVAQAFLAKAESAEELTPEVAGALLKQVQKETGFKGKNLFMPIRVALTGQMHGRDLNNTIHLLGQEKVIRRLRAVLS